MAEEKKLKIEVSAVNVKKIDMKAYGVKKARCQVLLKVGDKEARTSIQPGLDPVYEENFEFDVESDETPCSAIFYMGEEGDQIQIGDEQKYLLNVLKIGKPIYKGLIVPGGKVDMLFTAVGFGKPDVEDTSGAAAFDMMDDMEEGGMMMDSDDEDED